MSRHTSKLPFPAPDSFSEIFSHTLQCVLQNNHTAFVKYRTCSGTGYTSLAPVPCHYTVFPLQLYQCRHTPSPAPATRYNISIGLHKTNLSFTFSFGAQGQGFQQLGLKFPIFQFFIFLRELPIRANDC